jgi:WD40 repeat protein
VPLILPARHVMLAGMAGRQDFSVEESLALLTARLQGRSCALFGGAGLSALVGLPTRYDLARDLAERFGSESDHKLATLGISSGDADALIYNIVQDHTSESLAYLSQMAATARPLSDAHRILSKMDFCAVITSNWDSLLEETFPGARVFFSEDAEELQSQQLKNTFFLLKLSGNAKHPESLVLTGQDFERKLANNSLLVSFLNSFFQNQSILFVGCSWEGIESILRAIRFFQPSGEHFALMLTGGTPWQAKARQFSDTYKLLTIPYEDPGELAALLSRLPQGGGLQPTLRSHTASVCSVAVTADGRKVISASDDKTLKVWDLASGQVVQTFLGHSDGVSSVALTPDDKYAVSGSDDKTIRVWDFASGKELRALRGHDSKIWSVAVASNGDRIVSGGADKTVKIWDRSSGELLQTYSGRTVAGEGETVSEPVWSVAVTPDTTRLVAGAESVLLWELGSEEALRLRGHSKRVVAVAVTPDGKYAISGSEDNTLMIWDLATGESFRTLQGHTDAVRSVSFTRDGSRAISGSDDCSIKVWDVASGELLRTLQGHSGPVLSVAVTPDNERIVSGSDDFTIKVWNLPATRSRLRRAFFQNVGPFENLQIDFESNWTILLGNNGTGKSTLLKAIGVALVGSDAAPWADPLIRVGQSSATIRLESDNQKYEVKIKRQLGSGAELDAGPTRAMESEKWLVLGFPPLRTGTWTTLAPQDGAPIPTSEDVLPLVRGGADPRLDHLKRWITTLDGQIRELVGKGKPKEAEELRRLLTDFFSKIAIILVGAQMSFNKVDGRVFVNTDDGCVPIEQISQGMASLVSWVGVLLQRLYEVYGGVPDERYALVLMDEIDAHMHPKWQQILVPYLKKMFPNVQFIATTHSPLIVAGRSREEILVCLREHETKQVTVRRFAIDFHGLRADQILTSPAFDLEGARDFDTVSKQQRYRDLISKTPLDQNEESERASLEKDPAIASLPVEDTVYGEALAKAIRSEVLQQLRQIPILERRRIVDQNEVEMKRLLDELRQ